MYYPITHISEVTQNVKGNRKVNLRKGGEKIKVTLSFDIDGYIRNKAEISFTFFGGKVSVKKIEYEYRYSKYNGEPKKSNYIVRRKATHEFDMALMGYDCEGYRIRPIELVNNVLKFYYGACIYPRKIGGCLYLDIDAENPLL